MQKHHRLRLALLVPVIAASTAFTAPAQAQISDVARATSSTNLGMKYVGTSASEDVRVTLAGSTYTLDANAPIQAGAGCSPVAGDATKVTCLAPKVSGIPKQFSILPTGGADTVRNLTNAPMYAYGSAGNDHLVGSANAADELMGASGDDTVRDTGGENVLDGGTDDDVLLGGEYNDALDGGKGDDRLDGGLGWDRFDGGPGADDIDGGVDGTDVATIERHDLVDYGDRTVSVFVDLQVTGAQGEQGENDTLRGIEHVRGGKGHDVLTGNAAVNHLFGNAGNDVISGMRGRDVLNGEEGGDILFPSPAAGEVFPTPIADGEADIMDCGLFGFDNDGEPGDIALRVVADADFVSDCPSVFDY